jgi:hypothetical protein
MTRITRLAHDTAAALAAAAAASGAATTPTSSSSSSEQQWSSLRGLPAVQVVAAIEHCLFKEQQQQQQQQQQWYSSARCAGFSMPAYGRSNLPKKALLDHPGMQRTALIMHQVEFSR